MPMAPGRAGSRPQPSQLPSVPPPRWTYPARPSRKPPTRSSRTPSASSTAPGSGVTASAAAEPPGTPGAEAEPAGSRGAERGLPSSTRCPRSIIVPLGAGLPPVFHSPLPPGGQKHRPGLETGSLPSQGSRTGAPRSRAARPASDDWRALGRGSEPYGLCVGTHAWHWQMHMHLFRRAMRVIPALRGAEGRRGQESPLPLPGQGSGPWPAILVHF